MKTFENRFMVDVELRNIGNDVVSANVMLSMRLSPLDHRSISESILGQLLPPWVIPHCLYDGSFVLVSATEDEHVSNLCVASECHSLPVIDAFVELEDGEIHNVRISLDQSCSERRDYTVLDRRIVQLRGKISIEVMEDEASED